ncbi:non-ribosomal peptide synthetase [Labedaea rhizosphaerae]|uniref:Amino acid adenylation domain-containing protein n=1 Tax=Labedaea rhizosphaerae TaxID=598644 RepID=A0A4R6RVS8_LABRH|nr:non-ribosomal peptide synthetase [Labedaea rhizosphaerae]TDP90537.1 amino acid adenylation domain-containing protein [Labedaea rhizosphaerae]
MTDQSLGQLKLAAAAQPESAAFWRDVLAGGLGGTAFPSAAPATTGLVATVELNAGTVVAVQRITGGDDRAVRVLTSAVVLALLRVHTGSDVVTIGYRDSDQWLPLRVELSGDDTVREAILRCRDQVTAMAPHAAFPLAVLEYPPLTVGVAEDGDLDVLFSLHRNGEHLSVTVRGQAADDLATRFAALLTRMVADPNQPLAGLPLLTGHDVAARSAMNATAVELTEPLVLTEIFAAQAAATPAAPALLGFGRPWTYRELDLRANRLANTLRARGIGRDDLVAVLAERSPEMMVAILAVLKAGAAYLPVDPGYPAARIDFVLADSAAALVLAQPRFVVEGALDLLDETLYAADDTPPVTGPAPGDLAYVIYTSGSTGRPKGVQVEHRSAVNRLRWMQRAYPLTEQDVVLQKTPIAFDVSVWELFWWMGVGASLCLLAPGGERDPDAIVTAVRAHRVSTMHFVPSMLGAFLDYLGSTGRAAELSGLRQVFASGEALGLHTIRRFHALLPGARLINLYGPTEATVDVSHFPCDGDDRVSIGRPIDNLRLHVLDRALRPLPPGAPGELCIAGIGLARGYLGRPELTAERFVAAPLAGEDRVYRTGDLACWWPDGTVDYLGRFDHQVKLRGFRIELGEIETRLRAYESVTEAVVVVRDTDLDPYLCGYFVATETVDTAALSVFLGATLPEYMVPGRFVQLDAFPLAPNGKLDRAGLPEPRAAADGYVAPRTAKEAALAAVWAEVLGVERVGVHDNFFALGGNSIHFVSALGLARAAGVTATFQQLFAHPSIADLLAHVGEGDDTPREYAPFELLGEADLAAVPAGAEDAYPLAMLQEGLIYQSEVTRGTAQYHDVMSYLIHSPFDEARFTQAVDLLVARNPMLRTTYHLTGFSVPMQVVHTHVPRPLSVVDLRELSPERQRAWHDDWVAREQARRFRWDEPGLVRLHVQVLSADEFRYSIDLHNSALDGWSINLVHTKLFDLYTRLRDGLDVAAVDKTDHMRTFVGLEQQSLASTADQEFWAEVMAGARPAEVPGKLAPGAAEYRVDMHEVAVSAELSERVVALAETLAVPVKNVLLAAHVQVLGELSGTADVLTGYEQAGRPELLGAQDTIGMFLNTVPLRVRLRGGTWAELVRSVHDTEIAMLPRRRYPMARIKQDAGVRGPLFESVFNYTHFYPLRDLRDSFALTEVRAWAETEFVLRAEFRRHFFTDQVGLALQYHANVFDEHRIAEIGRRYLDVLESMTADPQRPTGHRLVVAVPPAQQAHGTHAQHTVTPVGEDVLAAERTIAAAWSQVLGIAAERIGPGDDFFALGGHSLSALRAVAKLAGMVSVADLTVQPTLRGLALVAVGRTSRPTGYLRRLREPADPTGTLVCFPYAAGNAVNYRPLAERLEQVTVLAVELPGHEVDVDEAFVTVAEAAAAIAAELSTVDGPLVLWGHCGGAAVAVETTRVLRARGRAVQHLVLGSKLLPTEDDMRGALAELARSTDADVLDWMTTESGYTALDGLDPAHADTIARAFRHDVDGGHRYFLGVCADPDRHHLGVPVTVVAAADDPLMAGYPDSHRRWGLLGGDVTLRELDHGGHYFIRTRAADCAALVTSILTSTARG